MKFYWTLAVAILFSGCSEFPAKESIKNLESDRILILGHGGMGSRALVPMNSLASFQDCFDLNPDGTELDVQMTKDCVLVAYHGDELFGTTECFGPIQDCNWNEIYDCYYKAWSSEKELLTMNAVLENFAKPGRIFSLDLKMNTSGARAQKVVAEQLFRLSEDHPEVRFFIESSDYRFLGTIDSIPENVELFYYGNEAERAMKRASEANLSGISINYRDITKKQVMQAHSNGLKVMLWGPNTAAGNKEAAHLSPDIIQTDRLDHLVSGLRD